MIVALVVDTRSEHIIINIPNYFLRFKLRTTAQDAYSKGQMATKKMQMLDQLVTELTNKNKIEVCVVVLNGMGLAQL